MSGVNEKSPLQKYIAEMDLAYTEYYKERTKCKNCKQGDMTLKPKICAFHKERGQELLNKTIINLNRIEI